MARRSSTALMTLGIALGLAAPVCSHAQTQAFTFTPDPSFDYSPTTHAYKEMGLQFNIMSTVVNPSTPVYALGFYDGSIADGRTPGLTQSHQIGIFDSSRTLLAQATIQAGTASTLLGNFRYTDQLFDAAGQALVGPLQLGAGSYIIQAVSTQDTFIYVLGIASLTPATNVSYAKSQFGTYTSLHFPDEVFHSDTSIGFFGGNFLVTALNPSSPSPVPEPGAFALLGGSLTVLGATWRRRRAAKRAA